MDKSFGYQIYGCSSTIEILKNLDQIRNLEWIGKYGKDNKKVGMWTAFWNGEKQYGVGGFYLDDGSKQGLWKELRHNYSNYAPIYEIGEYVNNQKRGIWKFILKNNIIGGGKYNDQGKKNGKWIELSNYFLRGIQRWQESWYMVYKFAQEKKQLINVRLLLDQHIQLMELIRGGGLYIEKKEEDGFIKKGKWVEELEGYEEPSHITFQGEYYNGIKVGIWDTKNLHSCNLKLGGGLYESQLNVDGLLTSVKVGKWIDLCDCFHYYRFITYEGEYQNGKKIGSWDIKWEQNKIGGGFYDDNSGDDFIEDSIKIGNWIEQSDTFNHTSQITYVGEYQNGKKHGKWDTYFRHNSKQIIGGGQYEVKQKDGIFYSSKIGFWTEIFEFFNPGRSLSYSGEYENGLKVGRWNTFYVTIFWDKVRFMQVNLFFIPKSGGGYYSILEEQEILGSLKTGKWIEVETEYFNNYFIISTGEYNYGKKVGRWDIWFQEENESMIIGGGTYNEAGVKVGKWVDLNAKFWDAKQLTYSGEYKNGKKVGQWDIEYRQDKDKPLFKIGGGSYNEKGDGVKIGQWIELKGKSKNVTNNGEYQKVKKLVHGLY
ncbi:unnamed protein product [Paramecium primaurelia]|uniref:Uncharacterized protein n=1 Tax=Paramecium primaurelia TaxID=5886 RepID=A0A8S1PC60_PARPR|nr:unnamed protein product [Paramecium primaurelia]